MPPSSPRRQRRKEARPGELLAAALQLFVEKGFAATRLEDVAARAGVSKGTLYLYFDSKEALFKAVIEEGMVPVIVANEALVANHTGGSFDLLDRLLENWWQCIGETAYSGIPKLMIAEARNFPAIAAFYYEQVICRGRALIATALRRGMASGEFRQLDVEATVDVLIAPILMRVIWCHSLAMCQENREKMSDSRDYLAIHRELLRQGLKGTQV